jgi:hypothetical protein
MLGSDRAMAPRTMQRLVKIGLCLLHLNAGCSSRDTREALVQAAAVTAMAIGAAALDAAAQEQAERDAQRSKRPVHVPNEPGVWRLVRQYDADDESTEQNEDWADGSDAESSSGDAATPSPVISIGPCMVCRYP